MSINKCSRHNSSLTSPTNPQISAPTIGIPKIPKLKIEEIET